MTADCTCIRCNGLRLGIAETTGKVRNLASVVENRPGTISAKNAIKKIAEYRTTISKNRAALAEHQGTS